MPLPPELLPPDPKALPAALQPPPVPATQPKSYLSRFKDIPGDIEGVFKQGLDEFHHIYQEEQAREPRAIGQFTNPLQAARNSTHLRGLAEDVSAGMDVGLAEIKGPARSLIARPLAEHYPLEKRYAEFEARSPSQRGLGSAHTELASKLTPKGTVKPMSPEQKTRLMEQFTDLLLPGGGILPYGRLFHAPPVDPLRNFMGNLSDELHQIRQQGTADRAEITQFIKNMPAGQRTMPVQRALYNWIERKDFNALPAEDQATLINHPDDVLGAARSFAWMRQELSNIYSRLRSLNFPEDQLVNPDYVHRRAVGHTPTIDPPLGAGAPENPIYGTQRTLPRTTSALQERRYLGGHDAMGNRVVVSVDPDSGAMSVHVPGGRAPIPVAPHPTNDNEFLYNGRAWAVGDTSSLEIERATANEPTPVRYYHNALANTADALARMRAVERHVDFLQDLTHRPEWLRYATRSAAQARRLGWQQPRVPQLRDGAVQRGWYVNPRVRGVLDDFYRPGMGESEALNAMRAVNQFAISTMFWNPVPHMENVLGHWVVGRGFDWITPQGVRSLFLDGARAIRAVTTQNEDYLRILRAGSGMAFAGVQNADFYRNVARLAGMDIERNIPRWDPIARMVGIGPSDFIRALYAGSQRTLWWANDVLMMQRVLELERKGMALPRAIREAEKHIPNYRIPSEVMGRREFSQILQEPALTVFSRYHYGMFRSYANMLNDLFRGSPREKLDAVGNMLALGLLTWVVYPLLDGAIQHLTGKKEDQKLRRGPASMPYMVQQVFDGDESMWRLLGDALTLSLPLHVAGTMFGGGGRDPFTGQEVILPQSTFPEQVGQGASYALGQLVQPWQLVGRHTQEQGGRSPIRAAADQIIGLKNTSDISIRGKNRAMRWERRAAQRRRAKPHGPIEEFIQSVGGDED